MNRKLLDGSTAPAYDIVVTLQVYTKCPGKWRLVDMETGEEYVGQKDHKKDWKRLGKK